MKVRDVMTTAVVACAPATNLAAAAETMWKADCGVLPVLDGGQLAGIITDRDICIALGARNRPAGEITVGEVAKREVKSCGPDDDLETAMATMRRAKVRRLPVLEDGKLAGIVALNDIAEAAGRQYPAADYQDVVETLKAVGEHPVPRPVKSLRPASWPPIPVAVA